MKKYLELFRDAIKRNASDFELNEIIENASCEIESNVEYTEFYELAMELYKQSF